MFSWSFAHITQNSATIGPFWRYKRTGDENASLGARRDSIVMCDWSLSVAHDPNTFSTSVYRSFGGRPAKSHFGPLLLTWNLTVHLKSIRYTTQRRDGHTYSSDSDEGFGKR